MATNAELYDLRWGSTGVPLRERVMASILKSAQYVLAESPTVDYHNVRAAWAKRAFSSPEAATNIAFSHVCLNPTIQAAVAAGGVASVPDSDIDYVVSAVLPILVDQS